MKYVTQCLVSVIAAFVGVALFAQSRPNLSGRWIGVGSQDVREVTITQDDSTLSIEGEPNVPKHTFKLDGSQTEFSAPNGKPLLATAVWEGNKLIVTVHFPEIKKDIRRVSWVIDDEGQLVMETAFLEGKPEPPTRQVFKRP
jgi:hypothetical protein